jgi:hypothetical protein
MDQIKILVTEPKQLRFPFLAFLSLGFLGGILWMCHPVDVLFKGRQLPWQVFFVFSSLLFLNLLVVSVRFWRAAVHLGVGLPLGVSLRSSMAGHIGGLFFIPLFGQLAGRQKVLGRSLSPTANASIAAYERLTLAVTSGALALMGALYLLEGQTLQLFMGSIPFGQIFCVTLMGYGLSLAVGRGDFEKKLWGLFFHQRTLWRVLEMVFLTVAGQGLVLACFVYGFHTVAPHISLDKLIAASAVVSFAASLPISVGGWGVREVAAVYMFGA